LTGLRLRVAYALHREIGVKTEFDRDFARWMEDPEFAEGYALERKRIDEIDRIVRTLDVARQKRKMTKADVARAAGLPAQSVRRFFTQHQQNPTLSVTVAIASAVGQPLIETDITTSSQLGRAAEPRRATNPRTSAAG
jgi:DNA-binding phage protein